MEQNGAMAMEEGSSKPEMEPNPPTPSLSMDSTATAPMTPPMTQSTAFGEARNFEI